MQPRPQVPRRRSVPGLLSRKPKEKGRQATHDSFTLSSFEFIDLQRGEMICRLWHGWTSPANADAYETLLREEVFRGIAARLPAGYHGIELLRRSTESEVEFITLMWFDSLDVVREFAGPDYEQAVVPPAARALLARFDARSSHFEVRIPGPAH